uniref:Secreted protein n=1 Tax=Strongyloides papillosus TaxID=174720 RepID=A0A0N5C3E2_STREA
MSFKLYLSIIAVILIAVSLNCSSELEDLGLNEDYYDIYVPPTTTTTSKPFYYDITSSEYEEWLNSPQKRSVFDFED